MIYLNYAGTSWPKPQPVLDAMAKSHELAPNQWGELYEDAHQKTATFFDLPEPSRLLFTTGCTAALGVAMTSIAWQEGDRILSSSMEHHALSRWFIKLALERGVSYDLSPYRPGRLVDLGFMEEQLRRGGVKLVALSGASNVTGERAPVREISELAKRYGAKLLVDGAQVSGVTKFSVRELGADMFVFAAHKGLLAPHGLGGLWTSSEVEMSNPPAQCEVGEACGSGVGFCDVGSVNTQALLGLSASLEYLTAREEVRAGAARCIGKLASGIEELELGLVQVGAPEYDTEMPTVAYRGDSIRKVAALLEAKEIVARAGLHCAPMAHQTLGVPEGTLRFSGGDGTTMAQVEEVLEVMGDVRFREKLS